MKIVRNIVLSVTFLLTGVFLGACTTTACAEQESSLKIIEGNNHSLIETWIIIDEDTGVNYIVFSRYGRGVSVSMTPRLNADGSLYTSK